MEKFERSEKELTYGDFLDDLAKHKKKLLKKLILSLVIVANLIVLISITFSWLK